ncbi:AcrR family transcriptional regulator [Actinoplanes tereljensis]|uniref:TetR family transcriptional regulator n=1 Tax=Paractinoplanes tereljensis TaxID=571912 RepID=A0A919NS69_9ACTN|nr:TetR/AcrR family transcriptional regulator C-terminal domain-containing protein [Actinoplanes tereljensis]GIF24130.1 TetR family transcriptional regulator [Actinoplanes tereljensis]
MPRPRSLQPDRLAAAAVAIIDRDGLAGLTMRAAAQELGLSTMALYRYVADRDELELLVCEWVLRDLDATVPDGPIWTENLKILSQRVRASLAAHQRVVPLLIANRQRCHAVLRWTESALAVLTAAGFDDADRVVALRGLVAYLNGALLQESLGALAGPGTLVMAALPAADFPLLRDTARRAGTVSADDEFDGGLSIVLRGLAAMVS